MYRYTPLCVKDAVEFLPKVCNAVKELLLGGNACLLAGIKATVHRFIKIKESVLRTQVKCFNTRRAVQLAIALEPALTRSIFE